MEKEKSAFIETFGESPIIKVLDFFLTFDRIDYSKSQVAEETGVSRVTIEGVWNKLEKEKIIVETRVIGRARLFKLNNDGAVVKALKEFDFNLASAYAESETADKKAKVKVKA